MLCQAGRILSRYEKASCSKSTYFTAVSASPHYIEVVWVGVRFYHLNSNSNTVKVLQSSTRQIFAFPYSRLGLQGCGHLKIKIWRVVRYNKNHLVAESVVGGEANNTNRIRMRGLVGWALAVIAFTPLKIIPGILANQLCWGPCMV
jgi:DNA-binding beta-propeller fold protein YncE